VGEDETGHIQRIKVIVKKRNGAKVHTQIRDPDRGLNLAAPKTQLKWLGGKFYRGQRPALSVFKGLND
jgi:hypothetical protein